MRVTMGLTGLLAAVAITANANSGIIPLAEWTFAVSQPTTSGPHMAEGGVYAASSHASRFHTDAAASFSSGPGNGSPDSFSSNRWRTGDYYLFTTSTAGYESITIQWDQTRGSNGPSSFVLQWSTDGTNFFPLHNYSVAFNNWNGSGSPVMASRFGPIAAPAALDNQPAVYFRMLNLSPTSPNGQISRIDNVIVSGVVIPSPGAFMLLSIAAAVMLRRPSRSSQSE